MNTPDIRAALERLVELDKGIQSIGGIPMDDWCDAIAAARAALDAEAFAYALQGEAFAYALQGEALLATTPAEPPAMEISDQAVTGVRTVMQGLAR